MEDKYIHIGIMFTTRCNIDCPHCGFECSPEKGEDADLETVKQFCMDAHRYACKKGKLLDVSFTGGEPFLRYKELLQVIRLLKATDDTIKTCIATNGFWAESVKGAKQILKPFKTMQCRIGLSMDSYHIQRIGINKIRNAIEALSSLNFDFTLKFASLKNQPSFAQCLAKLEDRLQNSRYSVHTFPCNPAGRANTLPANSFHFLNTMPKDRCRSQGNFILMLDGNVFICCGVYKHDQQLSMGKFPDNPFQDLLIKAQTNELFKVLRDKGPAYFVQPLEDRGYLFGKTPYTSICDLCRCVFKNCQGDTKKRKIIHRTVKHWRKNREQEKTILVMNNFFLFNAT